MAFVDRGNGLEYAPIDYEGSYYSKLKAIQEYYTEQWPAIVEHHRNRPNCLLNAYPFNWDEIFSPIENLAWGTFRIKGYMPFYPQFPVDKYFVDFADPFKKIGIELDGKEYHNPDRDIKRDQKLLSLGWTIYRITGTEMTRTNYEEWGGISDFEDYDQDSIDKIKYWLDLTGDGIIEAIKVIYYDGKCYLPDGLINDFYERCKKTLLRHILVKN